MENNQPSTAVKVLDIASTGLDLMLIISNLRLESSDEDIRKFYGDLLIFKAKVDLLYENYALLELKAFEQLSIREISLKIMEEEIAKLIKETLKTFIEG